MNSHPLVSVIVPVYNVEQYLEECVKSILSQTYKNLEIILVDDGATDSSGRMCDSYAVDDGRIKVVHKENGGLNSARQAGFEHAHGEWIAFVDSDDVIDGRYIELLLEANAKYGTEIAICGFSYFDNTIKKDTRVASFCMKDIDTVTRLYLIDARPENKFFLQTAWAKLFKRKLIEQVDWDFSDYRSNEDELMSVYYYKNTMNGVSFVNNQLYYYRQNPDSIMSKAQVEYKNSYKGMPTSKFEFLEDVYQKRLAMFGSKYRDEITYYYAMHFMVYIDKEYRKMPTYRLAKQEAELFNSKLDDIHKANKKYVFYDEYSDIFKVVSKKRDIQAFFDYRNSHPLVSVIVPVYNVEQYLEECVKSILSQTYKNLEIILVDDGATDSSGRMCDSYAVDDGRIKVVHKENGGVSRARNTGIEKSKGEYVLFVDADDYLAPKAIAVLVAHANAVAGVDMVIGDYAAHHSLGYEEEGLQRNLPVRQSFTFRESNVDAAYSLLTMVNATFCKLIKKDILIAHDISFPENLKIAEDLVFVVKVLLATTKLAYVDEVLYYYRVDFNNNTSAMGKVSNEKAYDFGKALKIVDTLIRDGRCGDSIKAALRKSAVAHSTYALELSEKDKAVHKKVFNYIHKDLFPYFHITEKDISNDDGTQLVLDGDYAGYIMWRLVAVKRYLHTRLDAVGYLEAEVAKKNAKIEELEGEIQYLKSVRGMIRTPLGQIYRRAKRLLRK